MPAALPLYATLPFVAMLLAIAILPLAAPHWWEPNRNKLIVSAGLGLPVLVLYLGRQPTALVHMAGDYVSFVVLLGGLYAIAGLRPWTRYAQIAPPSTPPASGPTM